ncbi:hypothetical protein L3Q82_008115 [Scortum barcoo]|uniref:Uncharacterized protein n=1 Tax=Scortum barcoo TaxID=214431 RepID=A0ACB8WH29_9TELE|nr:hypothetical protein L3Q82_008115 [Scortum barcoo]
MWGKAKSRASAIIKGGVKSFVREKRSTEDAVSIALHTALTHLQLPNTYVRMLFVDFSSAFNTVIPDKLVLKLHNLGTALIAVPLDQGLPHQQASGGENRGQHILYTGPEHRHTTPQGCVLSPALFTLFTSDCSAIHSTNTIVKFADDDHQ